MESIRIDGRVYVSHDCWVFGDYGGAGSLGLANIRVLLDECSDRVMQCSMNTLQHITEGCPYGLGSDELAEIRNDKPWLIHAIGSYGSEQVWVRKPLDHIREWSKQMERYPSLSDEAVSEVEMEWECEAWESWLKSDLIRTLDDESQDEAELMPDSALFEAYRSAMEDENQYPTTEYNGVHVHVDRIASAFAKHLSEAISDLYRPL